MNISSANCPAFDAERDVPVKRSENTFQIMALSMMREQQREPLKVAAGLLYVVCGWVRAKLKFMIYFAD
jgi:hypothetical protein